MLTLPKVKEKEKEGLAKEKVKENPQAKKKEKEHKEENGIVGRGQLWATDLVANNAAIGTTRIKEARELEHLMDPRSPDLSHQILKDQVLDLPQEVSHPLGNQMLQGAMRG